MRATSRVNARRPSSTAGIRSATEHAATISGTHGVGNTNSIGTNASWVGAVHELPTGY